tara:strand:+ start:695 stop:1990 length:1296 start_codon:yes stop_codon:yes gene_type:complete
LKDKNNDIDQFREKFNQLKKENSEIIINYLKDNKIDLNFDTSELTENKFIFLKNFERFLNISDLKKEILMWRSFFVPNSTYGHILGKSIDAIINLRENKPDLYCTDKHGVLKNSIVHPDHKQRVLYAKENKIPVILIFGGSTIMGQGSILPNYTIPSLIEEIYQNKFNQKKICCINFGVGGWSSLDSSKLFFNYAKNLNPNIVIFYDGWNCANYFENMYYLKDLENNFEGDGYRNYQHNYNLSREFNISYNLKRLIKLTIFNLISFIHKYFKRNGILDWKIRSFLSKYISFQSDKDIIKILTKKRNIDLSSEFSADLYLKIHKSIDNYLNRSGTSFMTFLQPLIINTEKQLTEEEKKIKENQNIDNNTLIKTFYEKISKNNLDNFHDLKNVFDSTKYQTFLDLGHLNKAGNFIIAEYIANKIYEKINNIYN